MITWARTNSCWKCDSTWWRNVSKLLKTLGLEKQSSAKFRSRKSIFAALDTLFGKNLGTCWLAKKLGETLMGGVSLQKGVKRSK